MQMQEALQDETILKNLDNTMRPLNINDENPKFSKEHNHMIKNKIFSLHYHTDLKCITNSHLRF